MKKIGFILLIAMLAIEANAQTIIYHSLKELTVGTGDTLTAPSSIVVEKRSTVRKLMQTGGDYRLASEQKKLRKSFRKKLYAVQIDSTLYINCRRVKINKFRFGYFYAPAMIINDNIYFCAVPIGPAAVAVVDRNIGMGAVGEAVASSSAISQRVFYEINGQTGKVEFVGTEKMSELLSAYPDLKDAYLAENNQEANVARKYLLRLKE